MASGGADRSSSTVCDRCSKPSAEHALVTILQLGAKIQYTVPSFPVFSATLVEMKFQFVDDDNPIFFDGYIRDCPGLTRTYPSLLKICSGYTNAFVIEEEEFDRCIAIEEDKILYEGKVFVLWKWISVDTAEQNEGLDNDNSSVNKINEVDSDQECEDDQEDDEFVSTSITHSIIFKCIGVTKSLRYQEVLAEAAQKLKMAEKVEVRLRQEPTNPKDSRAIAFDCKLGSDWELIGYVVKEALDSVHNAIAEDRIITVQFEWVRFITHWSRSGPGWYCGIKIAKKGDWPKEVVRCSSTF